MDIEKFSEYLVNENKKYQSDLFQLINHRKKRKQLDKLEMWNIQIIKKQIVKNNKLFNKIIYGNKSVKYTKPKSLDNINNFVKTISSSFTINIDPNIERDKDAEENIEDFDRFEKNIFTLESPPSDKIKNIIKNCNYSLIRPNKCCLCFEWKSGSELNQICKRSTEHECCDDCFYNFYRKIHICPLCKSDLL